MGETACESSAETGSGNVDRIVRASREGDAYRVWVNVWTKSASEPKLELLCFSADTIRPRLTSRQIQEMDDAIEAARKCGDDDMDDMPSLTDARRVVRVAMMVDEARRMAKGYITNELGMIRDHLSDAEFFACGGLAEKGRTYSLYRQFVLSKRDMDAYTSRVCFPAGRAVKSATATYEFYPSDDEDIDEHDDPSSKVRPVASGRIIRRRVSG